jgi:hypothetical protein
VEFEDTESKCKISCRVGQNQLDPGTVLNMQKIDPSTAEPAASNQRLLGAMVQVNSSVGILTAEYMYCETLCDTSGRRLLEQTRVDTCKVCTKSETKYSHHKATE